MASDRHALVWMLPAQVPAHIPVVDAQPWEGMRLHECCHYRSPHMRVVTAQHLNGMRLHGCCQAEHRSTHTRGATPPCGAATPGPPNQGPVSTWVRRAPGYTGVPTSLARLAGSMRCCTNPLQRHTLRIDNTPIKVDRMTTPERKAPTKFPRWSHQPTHQHSACYACNVEYMHT